MNCEELTRAVQTRLKELEYYTGFLDGLTGPMTNRAVIAFKRQHGLAPRDFVGPITLTRLFSPKAERKPAPVVGAGVPAWIAEAQSHIGLREVPGPTNNPEIMQWARDLDQWYPGDDVPWCGLFVAHCMAIGAPYEPQNHNRLGARAWLQYGSEVEKAYGAIAVFWRTHPTKSVNGHVGFLVGEDTSTYHILGGNQSDSVNITRVSKSRLLGFRGPKGWQGTADLASVTSGAVSTNEA
ncbi:hypothetical protein GCM10016455_05660 [Aliiroseovarius zhejiangensis]|uniref:Peptidoglycan binding-like domain-containing protein n=1 Tax=Aliiroseovarius zhejiangensis TaxID=1632025 RepID=A0ABQ3IM33_9RHOB|nr:TIGR02594 family protein [Aliiroseovarius zhejiangensis]GHE88397.1 hypothetical protein GCM10016455_05660 [Aliiroseovarius zhejiangensis]